MEFSEKSELVSILSFGVQGPIRNPFSMDYTASTQSIDKMIEYADCIED